MKRTRKVFFDELNKTLDKAVNKYDNIFITGDLKILTPEINLRIQITIDVISWIPFL